MTYLSKSQSFLASKATSLIGRTIVCTYDTGEGYFTKGKEYEIHKDVTGGAFLINNFGGVCHSSGSTFKLKQSPLTPKQPKAGEVWCYRPSGDDYNNNGALYHVVSVDGDTVRHRTIGGTQRLYGESVTKFIEDHVFVF